MCVKLKGQFHDLGHFTSDVANLPRIVTLDNIILTRSKDSDEITMEAVANTYRYLDAEEIAEQRRVQAKAKQSAKGRR